MAEDNLRNRVSLSMISPHTKLIMKQVANKLLKKFKRD
mgnify:CR=1 FL=1